MRNRWLTMDLDEAEDFASQHPYFFENFTFKFEGLTAEIQKEFENTVKSMSATVSDDTKYILTDVLNTSSSDPTKNYYSISYLSDSISAEEPLEIEDYKFSNLIESINRSDFCCHNARYIWKTKSCLSYFNQNFCCKSCMKKEGLHCDKSLTENNDLVLNHVNGETNDLSVNSINVESQSLHIESSNEGINGSQCDKSNEIANNVSFVEYEIDDVNLDGNFNNSTVQSQANGNYQENGVNNNNSDSSDIEMVEIQTVAEVEKPSFSTQKSKASKTNKKSGINRWRRRTISSSESDSNSESEDSKKQNRKSKRKRLRLSSSSSVEIVTTTKSTSDCEFNVDSGEVSNSEKAEASKSPSKSSSGGEEPELVVRTNSRRHKWWLKLPDPSKSSNTRSKVRSNRRDYNYVEKQTMIAYLVSKNLIYNATSRKPWESLHDDGHLQYRTVESLSNHFRKTILPNIESFNLPVDIQEEFIKCRKLHQNRR